MEKCMLVVMILSLLLMSYRVNGQIESHSAKPPVARKIPKVEMVHGDERVDNYYWLREKTNPDVTAYLEAENAYTDSIMKPTEPFQEAIYKEMLGRIKETDLTVPYRQNGYFYYTRTEQGKQYPIYCRKKSSLDAPEQITVNLNELAKGQKFMALGAYAVSDDGNLLAYSTDNTGFRQYTLFVKDLKTGELHPERWEMTGSAVWAKDNATLFYTVEDRAKRPYRLYRHRLGDKSDNLIYEEKDERFRIFASHSRSKAYLFLVSDSLTASEVRYLPADRPTNPWKLVSPRETDLEYEVDHHGELFYIRTNQGGRNFRLVTAPITDPSKENWKELIPHRKTVMLEGMDFFANYYVLLEREDGLPRIQVNDFRTGVSHRIKFPEPAYSAFPGPNREFDTTKLRYTYQSLITPSSVFDYDMQTRESTLLKQTPVLGGYDPKQYQSERLYAVATDGTRIPISLVFKKEMKGGGASPVGLSLSGSGDPSYKKGMKRDEASPMLLTAYGSYGFPLPVGFSSDRLSLLDRGVVFAMAHIRGGGEIGKAWHDEGRMMKKKNTFTDFIIAAEFLIGQKYTAKDRLVIEGASAGGLLMGAVTNMRPDLFKAVVSHVPFVDVINTMLDASLPLTVGEFEEWGNPSKKEEYDYMKGYCPYTNLAKKDYPTILVKTSLNDSQVMYWEPAKYVAKLRTLKTDDNLLLLKTNMAAGHGGSSGRYDRLHEVAFDYAFILGQFAITK